VYDDLTIERFWSKVDKRGPDECWPWLGNIGLNGYGRFFYRGSWRPANRIGLQITLGRELNQTEKACHHCDNPPCVNPAHLWSGSVAENAQDSVRKGRWGAQQVTHCPKGHAYAGTNLKIDYRGRRQCRACLRVKHRTAWERRKAAQASKALKP
jgi:hypothetical protein